MELLRQAARVVYLLLIAGSALLVPPLVLGVAGDLAISQPEVAKWVKRLTNTLGVP